MTFTGKISKFELYRLFKKGNLREITKYVKHYPGSLPYSLSEFKKEYIDALTNYACNSDYYLLWMILNESPHADQKRIVDCILNRYYHKLWSEQEKLIKHFDLFLDELMKRNDECLIFTLAKIATTLPKSLEYMARITSYCLYSKNNSNLALKLSRLPEYNDESLKMKIHGLLLKELIIYMSHCQNEENLKIAIEDYFNGANSKEVKELLVEFMNNKGMFKRIYDYIKTEIIDRKKAAAYLLEILRLKPDYHREDIIIEIIYYGSVDTISKLMTMLSEEEQNEWCFSILDEGNLTLIYDLAITTNCKETYKLIDALLAQDIDFEIGLLNDLKNRFLSYAWDYVFKNRSLDYIRNLLNHFYVTNSIGYITATKFIVEYKYISLFTEQEQSNIMEAYEEKEDMLLTLKK